MIIILGLVERGENEKHVKEAIEHLNKLEFVEYAESIYSPISVNWLQNKLYEMEKEL